MRRNRKRQTTARVSGAAAAFYLLCSDKIKARVLFERSFTTTHDAWSAMQAAVIAAQAGDVAGRDRALDAAADDNFTGSQPMHLLARSFRERLKAVAPVADHADFRFESELNTDVANLAYFTGEFLLIQGNARPRHQRAKQAAGFNTHKTARCWPPYDCGNSASKSPRRGKRSDSCLSQRQLPSRGHNSSSGTLLLGGGNARLRWAMSWTDRWRSSAARFSLTCTGDAALGDRDDLLVTQHPRERDLRGRGVVPRGDLRKRGGVEQPALLDR